MDLEAVFQKSTAAKYLINTYRKGFELKEDVNLFEEIIFN